MRRGPIVAAVAVLASPIRRMRDALLLAAGGVAVALPPPARAEVLNSGTLQAMPLAAVAVVPVQDLHVREAPGARAEAPGEGC